MSILLIILYILGGLIALLLLAALFTPKKYTVEREITINRSRQDVFNYIKFLKNQDQYNKWVMMDPNAKKTFSGTDGTEGFVYAWDSTNKKVGKGEIEIKKLTDAQRVDYEIRFKEPFAATSYAYMIASTTVQNQAKVSWGFTGDRNYVMKIFHLLFNLKKMLGKDLATSLTNLKDVLER